MRLSVKCSVAVHCLIFINEYGKERKVTGDVLANSTGVNKVTVRTILSALNKDGIISAKRGTGGAVISKPLSEVTLFDIYKSVEPDFLEKMIGIHNPPVKNNPVGQDINFVLDETFHFVRYAMELNLKKITLAWIVSKYHAKAGK